jgi:peptidoglycan/LPS O-acetylase OafA/YrhL
MLTLVSDLALLFTFATALSSKVRSRSAFDAFAAGLREFGVRRRAQRRRLAAAVVLAEAVAIVLLVLPMQVPVEARELPAVLLLLVFSVAVGRVAARRGTVACHCFGSGGPTRPGTHLVANLTLIALAVITMVHPGSSGLTAGDQLFGIGLGLIIGVIAVALGPVTETLIPSNHAAKERLPI